MVELGMLPLYIYDPTIKDVMSKTRGIGRYMQILHENMDFDVQFTDSLHNIPHNSILLNPFFDLIKSPPSLIKPALRQIVVIHDIIRLTNPQHFPLGLRAKTNLFLNRLLMSKIDAVVTDSHHSKHEIEENLQIPGKKIHVIYPIISRSIAVPRTAKKIPDQLPKKPYCLYVGDINWNKNLLNIARAVKISKIPCVCIGKAFFTRDNLNHPEKREFKKFIAETENDPLFIFPGYVSDQELLAYYTHAVCNILVSRDEGFGYSYFEAAACSTPSVLADCPIFHETARSAALFADPENPANIAAQILTFAQNAKTQKEYALYANHRLSDFTDETFTNSYKELVASLS